MEDIKIVTKDVNKFRRFHSHIHEKKIKSYDNENGFFLSKDVNKGQYKSVKSQRQSTLSLNAIETLYSDITLWSMVFWMLIHKALKSTNNLKTYICNSFFTCWTLNSTNIP